MFKNSFILNLTGKTGTGKTHLIKQFIRAYPGSIQLLSPTGIRQVFVPVKADWASYAAIALDEVLGWHVPSIIRGISALEEQVERRGKKLILITQDINDLYESGIVLRNKVLTLDIEGFEFSTSTTTIHEWLFSSNFDAVLKI